MNSAICQIMLKLAAATITFSGTAHVLDALERPPELLETVFRDMANNEERMDASCLLEVTPQKEFITYGVGIPMMQMRDPEKAPAVRRWMGA